MVGNRRQTTPPRSSQTVPSPAPQRRPETRAPRTRTMASGEHDTDGDIAAFGLTDDVRNTLLENISDGVYYVDRQRRILYWNQSAERITGFSAEEVIGRRCKDHLLNHCDEHGTVLCNELCPLLGTIRDGQRRESHVYLHHKDGHRKPVRVCAAPIHDKDGNIIGAVETFHDDSALAHSRQRAAYLLNATMRDPLTGVGNRRLGEAVLTGWLEEYHRFQRSFGLLFADIDHFKSVNDQYGHNVGDEALKIIARTFADSVRTGDQVIRWGGEEFVILLADADATTLAAAAERFRMLVSRARLETSDHHVELTVSIGGTLAGPGDDATTIIHRADALLYESKTHGRNRVTLDLDPETDLGVP